MAKLLRELGYSLQANRKTLEGASHPDRDAEFSYINDQVKAVPAADQPAISVDTKKEELVGDLKNNGREYRPKGNPEKVRVSVGIDHDTASFAVNSIRRWWQTMGRKRDPQARQLTIFADGGGSNGSRVRLWKIELQALANELDIEIAVCHLPPGTSKWNKIEHRLFSFITQNWRGRPLVSYQTIVQLIAATTKAGLTVKSELDTNLYPKGIKVANAEMNAIDLHGHEFHGEWNYTIKPKPNSTR